jgi:tripartite-type tricarboxylate transporter receptor subunit TctC
MRIFFFLCVIHFAPSAAIAAYPDKPIRLLVGYAPGGGADLIARTISAELSKSLSVQVVVDNRAGADGAMAAQTVARAQPDGYTVLLIPSNMALSPAFRNDLPYDLLSDFEAIALIASAPLAMAINPSLPAKSVRDFINLARSRKGGLTYGSAGTGGAAHVATELFRSLAKIDLTHVTYRGSAPALFATIAGEVDTTFGSLPSAINHMKTGALRVLAVTTGQRARAAPELPTIAESGLPGYEFSTWYGWGAPAKTPLAIRLQLHAEIVKALALEHVQTRLLAEGATPVGSDPDVFKKLLVSEVHRWKTVVKEAGILVK